MSEQRNHMKDIVRRNVPSAMRNNQLVEEYIDAIGDILQDIRDDINYKAFETDYSKSRLNDVNRLSSNFGLNLNPKLKDSVVRTIIRDAPEIFSQMGTRGTLEWALKVIGFRNFDIDEVWVPNPDLVRKGYFRQLQSNDDPRRYDISRRSYTDFVVGTEYVTDTGTYFEGYVYSDFEKETPIDTIPIYGETYTNYNQLDLDNMVSKTPYLLARLYEPPDFDLVIADVDPETGNPANVSIEEKQRIVNQTIRYLIQELQRTATTKIILVTDLFIFDTTLPLVTDQIEFISNEPEETITTFVSTMLDDEYVLDGRATVQATVDWNKVGENRPIGLISPYIATGEYTPMMRVGDLNTSDRDILDNIRQVDETIIVKRPPSEYEHYIFLDIGAQISFTAPSDSSVSVSGIRNYHLSNASTIDLLNTVSSGATYSDTITEYHAVILRFDQGSNEEINIDITY